MIKTYDYEVQKLYLELMLADAEVFVRCQGIFDHSLFDRKLQDAAEFMHEYAKGYNVLPDYEMVNATCRTELVRPNDCLLYTSPSPRDRTRSRMPSSA